ncbi:MAG: hypothetical protein LBN08_07585 [Lactobacillales bacterium]|nr:hypothetical protein [Lactobacillales bacterium]
MDKLLKKLTLALLCLVLLGGQSLNVVASDNPQETGLGKSVTRTATAVAENENPRLRTLQGASKITAKTGMAYQYLSADQKKAYDKIIAAVNTQTPKTTTFKFSDNSTLTASVIDVDFSSVTANTFENSDLIVLDVFHDNSGILTFDKYELIVGGTGGRHVYLQNISGNQAKEVELDSAADSVAKTLSGKTALQKIKGIRDYLAKNVKYDNDQVVAESRGLDPNPLAHYAYGALAKNKAVCDGYSQAFTLLASKLGVESMVVIGSDGTSPYPNHAWTLLKFKDKFYQMDVTWDASTRTYKFYMLNDSQMKEKYGSQYHIWFEERTPRCTDATYARNPDAKDPDVGFYGVAHIQNKGDTPATGDIMSKTNPLTFGTTGQALRVENITINENGVRTKNINIASHVQSKGDQAYAEGFTGTSGQGLRIERVKMTLSASYVAKYDIYYRTHIQSKGWMAWTKNGEDAGSAGYGLRAESIQVVLVEKGGAAPSNAGAQAHANLTIKENSVSGMAHIQNKGDTRVTGDIWNAKNPLTFGTTGQALRVENIEIEEDALRASAISVAAHVQSIGDTPFAAGFAGTSGRGLRMESVKLKLNEASSKEYSIWYRGHVQNKGWLGWAKDGAEAGSKGKGLRVESVQVVILPKTAAAPGSTATPLFK